MAKQVVIGLSGGVDSSVAAAVLKEQGYSVIGVTMQLWDGEKTNGDFTESNCGSLSAVDDARRVADKLGIEYHVLDFRKEFSEFVIDYFVNEYVNGRTPNPCIVCNKYLKFDANPLYQSGRFLHYRVLGDKIYIDENVPVVNILYKLSF